MEALVSSRMPAGAGRQADWCPNNTLGPCADDGDRHRTEVTAAPIAELGVIRTVSDWQIQLWLRAIFGL